MNQKIADTENIYLTPGQIAERDELGLLLTMIVPETSYDKNTGIWNYSGNKKFMELLCGEPEGKGDGSQ